VSPTAGRSRTSTTTATWWLVDRDGGNPRTVMNGSAGAGYEPAWSPDSTQVLVQGWARGDGSGRGDGGDGYLRGAGTQPEGIHYLWSADGRTWAMRRVTCQLGEADADGGNAHLVPVLGSPGQGENPDRKRSCDPS